MVKLGIVGATGLVGRELIKRLEERDLDIDLYLFASENSEGKVISYKGKEYRVIALSQDSIRGMDYLLFAAGGEVSRTYSPMAISNGAIVIDNSSSFRMDPDVPLVIPEINPEAIKNHKGLIANPNCSTIQSAIAIYPILKKYGLTRIIYNTYQSVSGSGLAGLEDLEKTLRGEEADFYQHRIGYNLIPQIDDFLDNGYTKEEMKMIEETNKIFSESIDISASCVRVPVRYGHAISINLETKEEFKMEDVFKAYRESDIDGLLLKDDISKKIYPTPLEVAGGDQVHVGRLRRDLSIENGINLWCVADNTRKGASTNAVQILELLLGKSHSS